jgi:hypothetical protein
VQRPRQLVPRYDAKRWTMARRGRAAGGGETGLERGAIDGGVRPSDAAVNVAACRPKSVPDRAPGSVSV